MSLAVEVPVRALGTNAHTYITRSHPGAEQISDELSDHFRQSPRATCRSLGATSGLRIAGRSNIDLVLAPREIRPTGALPRAQPCAGALRGPPASRDFSQGPGDLRKRGPQVLARRAARLVVGSLREDAGERECTPGPLATEERSSPPPSGGSRPAMWRARRCPWWASSRPRRRRA